MARARLGTTPAKCSRSLARRGEPALEEEKKEEEAGATL